MGESLLAAATRLAGGPEGLLRLVGPEAVLELSRTWEAIARPEQLPPAGDWDTWLLLAGRGFGKTRVGAETTDAEAKSGRARRIALVAPTAADARDVMVEGESGILSLYAHLPQNEWPVFEPSKRRVTWPNGARATLFSADVPNRLRGPQHDFFWADELAAWEDPQAVWDQLQFGLRLGARPRGIATTTPRPIPLVRQLVADATVAVRTGSTYDNASNLAPAFIKAIKRAYEGTRLGDQEIHARILDDNPGALWKSAQLEALRVQAMPDLIRVGIGVDPAVSSDGGSDETGIIAAGVGYCRCKGGDPELHGFVFDDASGIFTPAEWARAVGTSYKTAHADRVIAEVNNGGDLVESNIRTLGGDEHISFLAVHASRGKAVRAEPISSLYEQGNCHHMPGLGKLENQMTQWNPLTDTKSPDRVDALVWVLTWLMLGEQAAVFIPPTRHAPRRIETPRRRFG